VYRIEVGVEWNKGMLPKRSVQRGFRLFNRTAVVISNAVSRFAEQQRSGLEPDTLNHGELVSIALFGDRGFVRMRERGSIQLTLAR
jgi:hypothetical protein